MLTPSRILRHLHLSPVRIGIVGGTGYVGAELVRLLAAHPHVRLHAVTSRGNVGRCVNEHYPYIAKFLNLRFVDVQDPALQECDVVIFSTPLGTAMKYAGVLLQRGIRIIDLSPDFSLGGTERWKSCFACEHPGAALISTAVFGLPAINRGAIKTAALVHSPSSYSTAIILGALPLLRTGLLREGALLADIVVGMTSHGRVAPDITGESLDALAIFDTELPLVKFEVEHVISCIYGRHLELTCTPHAAQLITGLHATLHFKAEAGLNLFELYKDFYGKEVYVDVLPAGCVPETRHVRGSSYCKIAPHKQKNDGTAVILVAMDNLVKGAAGQAIQNLNIMLGLRESEGLQAIHADPKGHTA